VYAVVVDQGQLYTDLTGKFPVRSSKGNSYVVVCYIYDFNYIKVVPMNSRSASEWVKAYDSIHQELTVKGFKPKLQTLDNEASAALKNFFTVNDIAYQLVPHHCHRSNAAEPAIRTFKEDFLASVDPRERIMDNLFFPHNYQIPQLSSTDRLLMVAKDMMDALQNPHPEVPFPSVGDDTIAALTDLAAIFKLKLRQAPSPATQASPAKVVPRPSLIRSSTQILDSPMPIRHHTRSQTTIHTQGIPNVTLPPRVVTPRTLRHSPPRVPIGSQKLFPRNLSQEDFCGMDSAHMAIALVNNHWSQRHHANAVIHPVTGKEME
jgi:hypothetical protein